jgi:hypothetical protein
MKPLGVLCADYFRADGDSPTPSRRFWVSSLFNVESFPNTLSCA